MNVGQIRIRRVRPRGWLRRRLYEIEYPGNGPVAPVREITRAPSSGEMYNLLGVGDTWSMIHAANQKWNGSTGEWVQFVNPDLA